MNSMSTNQNNNEHLIKLQFVGLLLLVVEEKLQLYSPEKQLNQNKRTE
jgi:hypothetical protein